MSLKRRLGWAVGLLSVSLLALNYSPAAMAQDANAQQGQGRGNRGDRGNGNGNGGRGGRGNFDPAEQRQRAETRLKELLGATDQEWAVLQPKVAHVMDLQRVQMAGRGAGMGMLFRPDRGDRGNGNRGDRPARPEDSSPVALRTRELQEAIRNKAGPDELKNKLVALRDARTKAHDDLAKAQQELRELLTVPQEATMVMLGMLE
jgi:hypothetical protein